MAGIDFFIIYLYGLRIFTFLIAFTLLFLGIEDLIIDLIYWIRWVWRRCFIYTRHHYADEQLLFSKKEKPLAIMVPAWKEVGVIAQMVKPLPLSSTMKIINFLSEHIPTIQRHSQM